MGYSDLAIEKLAKRRERMGGIISNPILADDPTAIYNPGTVAHEAGHAKVHETPVLGPLLEYGPNIARLYLAATSPSGKGQAQAAAAKVDPYATVARLGDEAAASTLGMASLKKDVKAGKMSKEDYNAAMRGVIGAGATYVIDAAHDPIMKSVVGAYGGTQGIKDGKPEIIMPTREGVSATEGTRKALILAGTTASLFSALSERGGMNAEQAARKVHEIAPGVDTYALPSVVGGGAMYVPKTRTPLGGLLRRAQFSALLPQSDITRLSERGGVVIAPEHLGGELVGAVQELMPGPLGLVNLTGPAGLIAKGKRVVVPELEEQKGNVLDPEKAWKLTKGKPGEKLRGAAYAWRHPLAMMGQASKGGPSEEAPKRVPKEKAASLLRARMLERSASMRAA